MTFREVDLMIDENMATMANKHRVAVVVSDEFGHMVGVAWRREA